MSDQTWRDVSKRVIAGVETECTGKSLRELKTALHDAYPFGQRANFPYKVWCEEQRKVLARHPENRKKIKPNDQDILC